MRGVTARGSTEEQVHLESYLRHVHNDHCSEVPAVSLQSRDSSADDSTLNFSIAPQAGVAISRSTNHVPSKF